MREFLFRGKRKDNGEWIEGDFLQDKDLEKCYIEYFDYYSSENGPQRDYCQDEVVAETVGQYTGLTDDKNGKKIFEGDIVAVNVGGRRTICKVSWAETVAHFQLWQINTIPKTPTNLNFGNYDCEVIGNIHDNPELMKGGAE